MRIAACIAWFDEPVENLRRCVASLEGVVDIVVALDGPWQGFPHEAADSGHEQGQAIQSAAFEAGLKSWVRSRSLPWDSQIAKRSALVDTARSCGADWLFVIDADEEVAQAVELRARLDALTVDIAEARVRHIGGERDGRDTFHPLLIRALPGLHYERWHNGIRVGDRWLNGDTAAVRLEPRASLADAVVIHHHAESRTPERNAARAEFYSWRRRERIEA